MNPTANGVELINKCNEIAILSNHCSSILKLGNIILIVINSLINTISKWLKK